MQSSSTDSKTPRSSTGLLAIAVSLCASALACSSVGADMAEADPSEPDPGFDATGAALTSPIYGEVTYIGNIPGNKETDWFDHAQGVAAGLHDGRVVTFFSTNTRIYGREVQSSSLFGVAKDKPRPWEHGMPRALNDLGYNHFGDPDYQLDATAAGDDLLYVPIEVSSKSRKSVLGVFRIDAATMSFVNFATFDKNETNEAPWVAVLPSDPSQIFSSGFGIQSDYAASPGVRRYWDSDPSAGVALTHVETLALTTNFSDEVPLSRIQGGEFNRAGKLFLQAEIGPRGPGIYAFSIVTSPATSRYRGARVLQQFDYYPATITKGREEEFEGITVGVIDPPEANDISHIHAILNQSGDTFYKHWRVGANASHFAL